MFNISRSCEINDFVFGNVHLHCPLGVKKYTVFTTDGFEPVKADI